MHRSVNIFFYELFTNNDGILKVVAIPRHEGNQNISPQGQLPMIGCRSICQHITSFHHRPRTNSRTLVDTSVLIGPLVFMKGINIHIGIQLASKSFNFSRRFLISTDHNSCCISTDDLTVAFSNHYSTGIVSYN